MRPKAIKGHWNSFKSLKKSESKVDPIKRNRPKSLVAEDLQKKNAKKIKKKPQKIDSIDQSVRPRSKDEPSNQKNRGDANKK